jgi:hypothetical protein
VRRRRVSGVATKASFRTSLNPSPDAKGHAPAHRPGCDVRAIGDDEGAAGAEVVGGCWRNGSGTGQ